MMDDTDTMASESNGAKPEPEVANVEHGGGNDSERVELRIPTRSRYLRLARLTAAGFANDLEFDLQAIEDLRVAVDELCAAAMDGVPDTASLELHYSRTPGGGVRVDGSIAGRFEVIELHPVARELLGIVAGDYDLSTSDYGRVFWLAVEPRDDS